MATTIDFDAKPTWHRLYYLLALFDICAISASLYLNYRIMGTYVDSVAINREWSAMQSEASALGELAGTLDAPGNDIFDSQDLPAERGKLQQADRQFKHRLATLRDMTEAQQQTKPIAAILEDLDVAQTSAVELVRDATLTLNFFEAAQAERAAKHMASMDQRFSTLNTSLVRARTLMSKLQGEQFDRQTAVAGSFEKFEYAIAAMITLMVVGVTFYGRTIARHAAAEGRRKEQYRQELEQRVAERTADLSAANQARGELLKQLITAQEDERARMARDLHDGVGQSLTYLMMSLRRAAAAPADNANPAHLTKLEGVVAQTLDDVRRLARGLRPSVLDDLGLRPALERMIDDYSAANAIDVVLDDHTDSDERLPAMIETALFRIVQETLSNIAKHARASQVTVRLSSSPNRITVLVSDNGVGFDAEFARQNPLALKSVGLNSIRERAAILGGTSRIDSQRGQGTSVRVEIPLNAG